MGENVLGTETTTTTTATESEIRLLLPEKEEEEWNPTFIQVILDDEKFSESSVFIKMLLFHYQFRIPRRLRCAEKKKIPLKGIKEKEMKKEKTKGIPDVFGQEVGEEE